MLFSQIAKRLNPYMLYLKLAGLALLVAGGWYARGVYERAQANDAMQAAVAARLDSENQGYLIGLNLETGLNHYKFQTLDLDRKVLNATSHDTGRRFGADSVQRTAERIAAGEAARKRHDAVQ